MIGVSRISETGRKGFQDLEERFYRIQGGCLRCDAFNREIKSCDKGSRFMINEQIYEFKQNGFICQCKKCEHTWIELLNE